MIIVGSTALQKFGLNNRPVKDLDVWLSATETFTEKADKHIIPDVILNLVPTIDGYATPDAIYTIKMSHLNHDIFWEKTKNDILFLKSKGCTIIPELFKVLKAYWLEVHGNKDFLSLKKPKVQFFNDFVYYEFEHDFLHELVAYPNLPIYTYCLKDNEDVLIDKNKFDNLPFEEQVRMFKEEIAVIACERWILNPKNKLVGSWYEAYLLSLKKTITNLTKNWASDFIILNLELFVKPDYSYFKHILKTLHKENKMKPENVLQALCHDLSLTFKLDAGIIQPLLSSLSLNDMRELFDYLDEQANYKLGVDDTYDVVNDILNLHEYKLIEKTGGGEGGQQYCTSVFQLKDKLYKTEYSYFSYQGYDFDDIESAIIEVKPKQKTITVYE